MRLISAVVFVSSAVTALRAADTARPPLRFSTGHMDAAVRPGEDFYQHACGTWLRDSHIPPDLPSWTPTDALTEANLLVLRRLCESAAAKPSGGPVERLVGDFFAAATDARRIEALRFAPVEPLLARIGRAGGREEIAAIISELHLEGVEPLFSWYVEADERHSGVYALHLVQGGLSLPERAYYLEDDFAEVREKFSRHIARMFVLAGDDAAAAARAAATVLRFETALARASKPAEALNDSEANYHKLTIAGLEKTAAGFPWTAFLRDVGAHTEDVIAGQPEFLTAMARAFATEPLDTLKTCLRWQVLTSSAPLLHAEVDDEDFAFFGKVLSGQQEQRARWKRAVGMTDGRLGDALGRLYAAECFPPEAKRRMEAMVALIKEVFRDHIAKAEWMSPATRGKALAKLARFRAKLGFPEKWKDYAGLEIRRDDYHGNVRRSALWESRRLFARIGRPVDREEWSMTVPTVNAYFDQTKNEIVFPAGILQPPFFDPAMDDAVNYGATGATIAHELTHGFDSDGRKYDAEGNLNEWWTPEDEKEFERRAEALVAQFGALEGLPGVKVNGKLTLPENIADLGGIVLAYEALQRALAAAPPERRGKVDGLTPEQRFFISYAQSWAALQSEELLRQRLTTDSHSPDHLRATAPLQNFAPWFEAFGITPGMRLWVEPAKRATIW